MVLSERISRWWPAMWGRKDRIEYQIASSSLVFMLSAASSSSKYPFVVNGGKVGTPF